LRMARFELHVGLRVSRGRLGRRSCQGRNGLVIAARRSAGRR
jgi:hypothetical protein